MSIQAGNNIPNLLVLKDKYKGDVHITFSLKYLTSSTIRVDYEDDIFNWLESSEVLELSDQFLANKYLLDGHTFTTPSPDSKRKANHKRHLRTSKMYQEQENKQDNDHKNPNEKIDDDDDEKKTINIYTNNQDKMKALQSQHQNKQTQSKSFWGLF